MIINLKSMIQVYDTTLRDGVQREGISLSCADKLRIAMKLDDLGVAFIEGGWPGSNPKDTEFFKRARDITWKHSQVTAFGSTCRVNVDPESDTNIRALLDAQTEMCTVVGKSWTLHVTEVLRTSLDENLRVIQESMAYLRSQRRRVIYDAEHFFDGYKADKCYALETLRAAIQGGAETLVLCDTNGGSMPWEISEIVQDVKNNLNHPLGIHAHNDGDCAVANSLAAVKAGVIQVQGTMNGYGERCGNANLCSLIPNIEIKSGLRCLPNGNLASLYDVSHFIAEVANLTPDEHAPFVGKSAFAHKGGLHTAAVRRNQTTYQHIEPLLVGNQSRMVISELSGRSNVIGKSEEYGLDALLDGPIVADVLNKIKELESRGFSFEAAEASVAMMIKRKQSDYQPPFELIDFLVNVEHRQGRGIIAEATVKLRLGEEIHHIAAEGNGPVNALDTALRKALTPIYPELAHFHLVDYKVRILDGDNGTGAVTRVLIDTQNGSKHWSTVGASANIIEASWLALVDSIEYGLLENKGNGEKL
jgi:2-isopropylmalate synthase